MGGVRMDKGGAGVGADGVRGGPGVLYIPRAYGRYDPHTRGLPLDGATPIFPPSDFARKPHLWLPLHYSLRPSQRLRPQAAPVVAVALFPPRRRQRGVDSVLDAQQGRGHAESGQGLWVRSFQGCYYRFLSLVCQVNSAGRGSHVPTVFRPKKTPRFRLFPPRTRTPRSNCFPSQNDLSDFFLPGRSHVSDFCPGRPHVPTVSLPRTRPHVPDPSLPPRTTPRSNCFPSQDDPTFQILFKPAIEIRPEDLGTQVNLATPADQKKIREAEVKRKTSYPERERVGTGFLFVIVVAGKGKTSHLLPRAGKGRNARYSSYTSEREVYLLSRAIRPLTGACMKIRPLTGPCTSFPVWRLCQDSCVPTLSLSSR